MTKQIETGTTTCLTGVETHGVMAFVVPGGEKNTKKLAHGGSSGIAKKLHYLH
jgi:hypothetical protein